MKSLLLLLPVILSALVMGAHFLRGGHLGGVLFCVAALFLLTIREAWVARLMQLFLLLGALVWIWTMIDLAGARRSLGEPWIRMAVILSSVALFTAASGLVFQTARLKARYPGGGRARSG